MTTMTAHILQAGAPLCGFSRATPDRWPPTHWWVSVTEVLHVAHAIVPPIAWCAACKARFDRV